MFSPIVHAADRPTSQTQKFYQSTGLAGLLQEHGAWSEAIISRFGRDVSRSLYDMCWTVVWQRPLHWQVEKHARFVLTTLPSTCRGLPLHWVIVSFAWSPNPPPLPPPPHPALRTPLASGF